ncbi:hypothetical protein SAMN05660293_00134 [Dyadobacter psychrophilus]|uniref:Uncharacterized protein n=1 Tax=Dyadobacter psychrophilus TaxID=651661 RepID=A0A1T5B8Y7_9BACT|nr:hypothetical protein SAMN05660293_00134 [Dyadobacter psychrophilus]
MSINFIELSFFKQFTCIEAIYRQFGIIYHAKIEFTKLLTITIIW